MKIVSVKILKAFWEQHPETEQHLKAWVDEVRHANWQQPADIKSKYRMPPYLKIDVWYLILKVTSID